MNHSLRLATLLLVAALAACGKSPAPESAAAPAAAPAPAVMPSDPALAKLYGQTCKACHGNPGNPAPQAGDAAAWQPRVAQGLDTLVSHAVSGYKGMPPLGTCSDCTPADFEALIKFMSGAQK